MKHNFALIAGVFVLTIMGSADVDARTYTRSCNAAFRVTNAERNMVTVDYGQFSARASMDRYKPNTIRVRAYNRAVACIRAAWRQRNAYRDTVPSECTQASGIYGYEEGVLAYRIGRAACRAWGSPRGSSVRVNVYANVWGDKGCGGDRRSKSAPWVAVDSNAELTCR